MERVEEAGRRGGRVQLCTRMRARRAARCVSRDALSRSFLRFCFSFLSLYLSLSVFVLFLSRSRAAGLTLPFYLFLFISLSPHLFRPCSSSKYALACLLARSLARSHVEAVPPVRRALLPSLRPSSPRRVPHVRAPAERSLQRFSTASVLTRTERNRG